MALRGGLPTENGFVGVEGVRLVEEALRSGCRIHAVLFSESGERHHERLASFIDRPEMAFPVLRTTDRLFEGLADTEHPQGVVAVVEPRVWSLADVPVGRGSVVLVLDSVQDPGNVGAMLRTALGLGAAGVVALKGTAELTNPKVLRGSMGAVFRLPAVSTDADALLAWAGERGVELWVTAANGQPAGSLGARSTRPPIALVLGNEGAGVGAALEAAARRRVAIPLAPGVESLNVAVAAGILLHEVTRDT